MKDQAGEQVRKGGLLLTYMFYRALHKAEYSFVLVRVISWIAFSAT